MRQSITNMDLKFCVWSADLQFSAATFSRRQLEATKYIKKYQISCERTNWVKIRTERKSHRPSLQCSGRGRFLPIPVPALSFNLHSRAFIPTLCDFSRETNEICALLGHYAAHGGNDPETSGRIYHHALRNISEERRSHSHLLDRTLSQFGVL